MPKASSKYQSVLVQLTLYNFYQMGIPRSKLKFHDSSQEWIRCLSTMCGAY